MKKDNIVDEWCPYCESEVELKREFKVQICPVCGRWLLPCSMCDMNNVDCSKCALCDKVDEMEKDSADVLEDIKRELSYLVTDNEDREEIAESLLASVYNDVVETADEDYTDADIRTAIVKILKKKFVDFK